MKKSAKLKRKTRRLILKNLIVFTVLIAVASVGVRSWFNNDDAKKADAKGMTNISFAAPEGMQVAVVAPGDSITSSTVWHEGSFSLSDSEEFPFISTVKLSEISSDGRTFIKPPIMQYSSVAYPDNRTNTDWSSSVISTTPNAEYLSFDVYFRTRNSGYKVQLDSGTYCGPDDITNISSNDYWGNSVTGWSPDTVIGAARVSVIDPTVTAANAARSTWQKLLWIPAPFLHYDPVTYSNENQLKKNVTNTGNTYGLVYKSSDSYINLHNDGTYNHGYWLNKTTRSKVDYNSSATNATSKVTANTSLNADDIFTLPYDVNIANLTTQTTYNSVQYYTNHVRVNLWIEGEDPESRSIQLGGQVKAIFKLKLVTA